MSVDARDARGDRGVHDDGEQVHLVFLGRSLDHCRLHRLIGEGVIEDQPSQRGIRKAEGQELTGIGRLTVDQEIRKTGG